MRRLFIAEKPDQARLIARQLGRPQSSQGYISVGDDILTWCFGHLFELAEPEEYDAAWGKWSLDSLPMFPSDWKLVPKDDQGCKKQIKIIRQLLAKCDQVVHAADGDREGQLIVDELLDYFGNKRPVLRLWTSSLDPKNIQKALNSLYSNDTHRNLTKAAETRRKADWAIGLNMTRALTVTARSQGALPSGRVLSYGRVQTPTLRLVVERDLRIENFVARDYFVPQITVQHQNGDFVATWVPGPESKAFLSDGRLFDRPFAERLVAQVKGQPGTIVHAADIKKFEPPPLPNDLRELQGLASDKLDLKPDETLKIAQRLYDGTLTTYPRTDCRHLPEEQFEESAAILDSLVRFGIRSAAGADVTLRSACWNTEKVNKSSHHAIIPSGLDAGSLSGKDRAVYDLIAEGFILQFYPPAEYLERTVIVDVCGEQWRASSRELMKPGWNVARADNDPQKKQECQTIPLNIFSGENVQCLDAKCESKRTSPPRPFTVKELLNAMASVHLYVSDPSVKKRLKESSGIGTPATRSEILKMLVRRKLIAYKGRKVVSTPLGRDLINVLPPDVTDPGMTALWEDFLDRISAGKATDSVFLGQLGQIIPRMIQVATVAKFQPTGDIYPCPECGHALSRLRSKTSESMFWACFNNSAHSSGKPVFLTDMSGKPGMDFKSAKQALDSAPHSPCPEPGCQENMVMMTSSKNPNFKFWRCPNKGHPARFDNDGKPGNPMKKGR